MEKSETTLPSVLTSHVAGSDVEHIYQISCLVPRLSSALVFLIAYVTFKGTVKKTHV